jgi:uncharacterized membrane protein
MEEIVVVVFESELKAIEAFKVLRRLDHENLITVYEAQVISKGSSGAVRVVENEDAWSFPLIGGTTVLGGLIGLLGGPLGVMAGASLGGIIGCLGDLKEQNVVEEFVHDVKLALAPDKSALVADLEEWVKCLDERMAQLGGVMIRRIRDVVAEREKKADAVEHRVESRQLKAEEAEVRAHDLAGIDAKVDRLRANIEKAIEGRRIHMQLRREQQEAKIKALEAKAEQAQGEIRRRQQDRIAELRREYSAKTSAS